MEARNSVYLKDFVVGAKFNAWTVLAPAPYRKGSNRKIGRVVCRCACGQLRITSWADVRKGRSRCCGCLGNAGTSKRFRKHGRTMHPMFSTWESMKYRCYNPKAKNFYLYGAKGVRVCDAWLNSLEQFCLDMGERPSPQHTIDRIDSNGNYEPSNCRWATPKEQARNTSRNRIITFNGETLCLKAWAERTGLTEMCIHGRLRAGWSIENTITAAKSTLFKKRKK